MPQYLVSCRCGTQHAVEARLAGGRISCACGQAVEVPTLRELRCLPLAPTEKNEIGSQWTVRHGMAAAAFVAAIGLAIFAGYLFWQQWRLDQKIPRFVPEQRAIVVAENLRQLTPSQTWELWIASYLPMARQGFLEFPGFPEMERQVANLRFAAIVTSSISAAFAFAGLVIWLTGKRPPS